MANEFVARNGIIALDDSRITGSLSVSGGITGSLFGTASWAENAVSSSYADTSSYVNPLHQTVIVSGAVRLDPSEDPGNVFPQSTFLFQSASNTTFGNDLYIRQDGNLVKWKWIEGNLQSGILYGGVISYTGSIISVSSGSGIIVNYNASTGSEIFPVINYVNWPSQSKDIASNITSSQATYIYIDSSGVLQTQADTFFTNEQYSESIPLGMVNHTGRNTITSVANNVYTSYGATNQTFDFIEAFGPLKVRGLTVSPQAGSLHINVESGESFILGGFYQQDPNRVSHKTTSTYATASIARVHRSGSSGQFITDNNNGAFYTNIDPTKYDNNGVLTSVGNNWSIQRVFFNPFTGRTHVYYGQNVYDKLETTIANLSSDSFSEATYSAHQYVFVAYLIVYGNPANTNLSSTQNKIVQAGLFRNTVGSTGATVFTNRLENLSDVNINSPINGEALIYDGGVWVNKLTPTSSIALGGSGSFSGSFSGSGASLFGIPASGIVGLNLSQISSGSVSASVSPAYGFTANGLSEGTGSATVLMYNTESGQFFYTASSAIGGGGGGIEFIQDATPDGTGTNSIDDGIMWFKTDTGTLYIYYHDVDTYQWVEQTLPTATGPAGPTGPNNISTSTVTAINAILKGNGLNVEAAIPNTDYQAPIGYTPENQANKETVTLDTSNTKYPTNNVVKTALDNFSDDVDYAIMINQRILFNF